ncbi:MAG TPA: hypothetical protein VLS48_06500 [Anaerolineales bacterium]|nr:hypothetical protein [Anaerolineales bacterium]
MRPDFRLAAQSLRIVYAVYDQRPEKLEEEKTPIGLHLNRL